MSIYSRQPVNREASLVVSQTRVSSNVSFEYGELIKRKNELRKHKKTLAKRLGLKNATKKAIQVKRRNPLTNLEKRLVIELLQTLDLYKRTGNEISRLQRKFAEAL